MILIDDAYVVCGAAPPAPSRVLISGDAIEAIGWEDSVPVPEAAQVIQAFGRWVLAGFVDLHMHGANGASFMDGTPEAFAEICRWAARQGTTSVLATLDPASPERLLEIVSALAEFESPPDGARLLGIHLEGPFLNADHAGAHDSKHLRSPSLDELERLLEASRGKLKYVTIAPELPGAVAAIDFLRDNGVVVGLGHSGADFRTARRAVAHGALVGTHVPHSLPPIHQRDLSITTVLMTDDRVTVELIANGVHVHPAIVRLIVRAKQPHRVALVSNAIFTAGLPDGDYTHGEVPIAVRRGVPRRADVQGVLAGSSTSMGEAFSNIMRFANVTAYEASCMASAVPATVIGEYGRLGRIAAGMMADITILDHDGSIWMTIVGGHVVYKADG